MSHAFIYIIPAPSKQSKKTGPTAVWRSHITVEGYQSFSALSFTLPTEIWMRSYLNLLKIDVNGTILFNSERLKIEKELVLESASYHTVTHTGELLFLGDKDIKKLTSEGEVTTLIAGDPEAEFTAICSCSNGDILTAIYYKHSVKILRYSGEGITRVIQKDDGGKDIYIFRIDCMTENKKNQDILTSDVYKVIGVEKKGRYKFSYTGHFPEKKFAPQCIATDSLGQIIVGHGYERASSIHLLTENGIFLSFLLTYKENGIVSPLSIGVNESELYVLYKDSNKISVYDYQLV
jgi:hypothetical protein